MINEIMGLNLQPQIFLGPHVENNKKCSLKKLKSKSYVGNINEVRYRVVLVKVILLIVNSLGRLIYLTFSVCRFLLSVVLW